MSFNIIYKTVFNLFYKIMPELIIIKHNSTKNVQNKQVLPKKFITLYHFKLKDFHFESSIIFTNLKKLRNNKNLYLLSKDLILVFFIYF